MKNEYDVSDIAWRVYRIMYEDFFNDGKIVGDIGNKRPHLDYCFNEKNKEISIHLSGDTDFNYTKGFAWTRLPTYQKMIKNNPEHKELEIMYTNNLNILEELTYSVVNISLIPQTGNVQSFKQGIGNDRLDTYIWALNAYYQNKNCLIFNHSSYDNMSVLKAYYDSFKGTYYDYPNIYDYCDKIYKINETLADDLIESGKKAIDSPVRIMEFMKLTMHFWNQKAAYIRSKAENCKEVLYALDDYDKKIRLLFSKK